MGRTTMRHSKILSWASSLTGIILLQLLQFQDDYSVECVPEISETAFCEQYVRSKGYLCEEHKVYSGDGFELLLHRVRIMQSSSAGESDSSSNFDELYQSNVKLALGIQRKDASSGAVPKVELTHDSKQKIEPLVTDDYLSGDKAQHPYQLGKSEPYSNSVERDPFEASSRGGDARNSPENRPLHLPPYWFDNPGDGQSLSSPSLPPPVSSIPTSPSPSPEKQLPPVLSPIPAVVAPSVEQTPTFGLPPTVWSGTPSWTIQTPISDSSAPVVPPSLNSPTVARIVPTPSSAPRLDPSQPTTASAPPQSDPDLTPTAVFPSTIPSPVNQILAPLGPEWTPLPSAGSSGQSPTTPVAVPSSMAGSTQAPVYLDAGAPSKIAPAPVEGNSGEALAGPESVLLMHHELLNGDSWFKDVSGNGDSPLLPFLLADGGFEVWVGHERATYWGHDHINLDSSNEEYWNWTWDEHVQHDVPTMLVYITAQTQSKTHVVGVSQSAAVGAAVASQPDVALLIRSLILVGPTIYRGSVASPIMQTWAGIFAKIADEFNITREFDLPSWSLGGPASMISGPDCCIGSSVTLFDNGWDGTTSYKNLQHFEQGVLTNSFQHFDYGSSTSNLEAYGQPTPASYLPGNIPADLPVLVIYGGQDFFSPPEGIQELLLVMQKLPVTVYLALYAHFDLFFSSSRNEDVYQPILSFLQDPTTGT